MTENIAACNLEIITGSNTKITWSVSDSSIATVKGSGKKAIVTAIKSGSATVTAKYIVNGTTVMDTCTINVQKAASTMDIHGFSYSKSGTMDSFQVNGVITSNYALKKIECIGTTTSNALGITVGGDTTDPYYFKEGVYSVDVSTLRDYFIDQYRAVYNLYVAAAGLFGADNSVTVKITLTCYDLSGYNESRYLTYTIYAD